MNVIVIPNNKSLILHVYVSKLVKYDINALALSHWYVHRKCDE